MAKYVLTICTNDDEEEIYTHLFHKFENAVDYVIDGAKHDLETDFCLKDYKNPDGTFTQSTIDFLEGARKSLMERKCWTNNEGGIGATFMIDELEFEDEE